MNATQTHRFKAFETLYFYFGFGCFIVINSNRKHGPFRLCVRKHAQKTFINGFIIWYVFAR